MKKKYKGLVIADVHVGAFTVEKLYEEYINRFINHIKEMKELDFVIICGDFFDRKLYLNEIESKYAYQMVMDLIQSVKEYTKIRFVYGTESHDCNQYEILNSIIKSNSKDIKVIKHVCEEELFPDIKILYIPEENILDKKDYYCNFLNKNKEYQYVFGHGIIREAMKEAATQNDASSGRKKVPVFSTAELRKICNGQVFFGHYHIHTDMDDIFYVGSFSRWVFGEEEPKGFFETTCDIENKKYKAVFIENDLAEIYRTINFGYDDSVFDNINNMEEKLDHIDSITSSNFIDHIRFQFNIPKEQENPEFLINYIKERYKFQDKKVKLNFVHGYTEEKRKKQKEEIKKENDKFAFIYDKNIDFEDKTKYFIEIEYNSNIDINHIKLYLYHPLDEILNEIEKNMMNID